MYGADIMAGIQTGVKIQKSSQTVFQRSIGTLERGIRTFKSLAVEGIFKKKKFTKEELEQAEQAWIRG
ncbi:MAG: hypothetical protein QXK21_00040 [Candidatus Micrarchaeia archaeon]